MMQQTNINQKCKAIYFVCVLYFQSFFYIINTINKNWNKSRTFKPENWCINTNLPYAPTTMWRDGTNA